MSQLDSSNAPSYQQAVCSQCFEDKDIADFITECDGPPGCSFCAQEDAPTAPLKDVIGHIRECLERFFGFAADQLRYDSEEGGYLGKHWDTYELLYDEIELSLSRGHDDLFSALADGVGHEVWCTWDWLTLDYDEDMKTAWRQFLCSDPTRASIFLCP